MYISSTDLNVWHLTTVAKNAIYGANPTPIIQKPKVEEEIKTPPLNVAVRKVK